MTDSRRASREWFAVAECFPGEIMSILEISEKDLSKDVRYQGCHVFKVREVLPQSSDRKAEIEAAAFNACFSGKGASEEKRSWTWEIFWDGWKKALAFADTNPADSTRAMSSSCPGLEVCEKEISAACAKHWRKQLTAKDAEIERLKASEQWLVKQRDEAQGKYEGVSKQRIRFAQSLTAEKEKVVRLREALGKFTLNPLNESRLDQVPAEQLRMIILHGESIAREALSETETGKGKS